MKIVQTLVESQIKNGILDILKESQPHFPKSYTAIGISVFFDDDTLARAVNLTGWKFNTPMLTGLKRWYSKHSATVGDKVVIEVLGNNKYRLSILKSGEAVPLKKRGEKTATQNIAKPDWDCFDYKDASVTLKRKGLLSEVEQILGEVDKANHTEIQRLFRSKGWETEKRIISGTTWAWDAYKDKIVVSIEFSLIDAVHRDFFRLLMWHHDNKVEAVVYVTTTFQEPKFHNVKRDIEILQNSYPYLLPVPIYLVGLKQ